LSDDVGKLLASPPDGASIEPAAGDRNDLAEQVGLACARLIGYYLDMRIVVIGDSTWECQELATRVLRRLVARYGPGITIIHGNQPGVDQAFAAAANELGVTTELRVIDRHRTGHPTIGQRNRELLMGKADMSSPFTVASPPAPGRLTSSTKPCRTASRRTA
jgi:hypothetical protein